MLAFSTQDLVCHFVHCVGNAHGGDERVFTQRSDSDTNMRDTGNRSLHPYAISCFYTCTATCLMHVTRQSRLKRRRKGVGWGGGMWNFRGLFLRGRNESSIRPRVKRNQKIASAYGSVRLVHPCGGDRRHGFGAIPGSRSAAPANGQ